MYLSCTPIHPHPILKRTSAPQTPHYFPTLTCIPLQAVVPALPHAPHSHTSLSHSLTHTQTHTQAHITHTLNTLTCMPLQAVAPAPPHAPHSYASHPLLVAAAHPQAAQKRRPLFACCWLLGLPLGACSGSLTRVYSKVQHTMTLALQKRWLIVRFLGACSGSVSILRGDGCRSKHQHARMICMLGL